MTYLSLPYALLAAVPLLCHVYTLPVYAHMILMTLLTIFIGAHQSLPNTDESAPPVRLARAGSIDLHAPFSVF